MMRRAWLFGLLLMAVLPAVADIAPAGPMIGPVNASSSTAIADTVVASTEPAAPITFTDVPNNAFGVGEKLTFVIKYQFVSAGIAMMEVSSGAIVNGRPTMLIETKAESNSVIDKFFKVRDFNSSTVDARSLMSLNFHQNLKEGGYSVIRNTAFDYARRSYKFSRVRRGNLTERSGKIDQPIHDILSAFFYTRTLDLKPGGKYSIKVFSDEDVYSLVVNVYKKTQKVSVPAGKFECLRLEPVVLGDGIFKGDDGRMLIWLTNDERKIPVQIRSKVFIGAFDAELVTYTPTSEIHFDTPSTK